MFRSRVPDYKARNHVYAKVLASEEPGEQGEAILRPAVIIDLEKIYSEKLKIKGS